MHLVSIALMALGMAQAQTDLITKIKNLHTDFDTLVKETLQDADVPGLFVVVTLDGKPLYQRPMGHHYLAENTPYTASSTGRLASATKVLFGLTVMSMVEDREIDLTTTLCEIDRELPVHWCPIPMWRLMNHSSGIPMIVAQDSFHAIPNAQKIALSKSDLMALIKDLPLDFAPGEGWHYQQSGLVVLAHLIEKQTGKLWQDLVNTHVLHPADMTETRWTTPMVDQAPAYDRKDGLLVTNPFHYPQEMSQGGGYDTTGNDLIKLLNAIAHQDIVTDETIITELLQEARLTKRGLDVDGEGYGLGSIIQIFGNTVTFGHSGGGGLADIRYALEPNLGVAVLTNRAGGTAAANTIASRIMESVLGEQARRSIE